MAKRETNKERRAREHRQRGIFDMATEIAGVIHTVRYCASLPDSKSKSFERAKESLDSALEAAVGLRVITGLDAKWFQSQSIENIARALRLAADILEEKPQDGRTFSDHDEKILEAFLEATARVRRDHPNRVIEDKTYQLSRGAPTFSEFLQVYHERNPRVKVEARTLRRTLQRLRIPTHPDKLGRPNGK
jgi:hypothetical protein